MSLRTRLGTPAADCPPSYLAAMSVEAMQVFTAVLALGAVTLAVVVVTARLGRRRSAVLDEIFRTVDDAALWIAFLVAALATAGSLYFSEVANYVPCRLCWYQRIAMYPLAVILLVAADAGRPRRPLVRHPRRRPSGACVSIYHYLVEWHPQLEGDACDPTNPCSLVWFREFGFVTLALMALCGFVAIIVLLLPIRRRGTRRLARPTGDLMAPPQRGNDPTRTLLLIAALVAVVAVIGVVVVLVVGTGGDDDEDTASSVEPFRPVTSRAIPCRSSPGRSRRATSTIRRLGNRYRSWRAPTTTATRPPSTRRPTARRWWSCSPTGARTATPRSRCSTSGAIPVASPTG